MLAATRILAIDLRNRAIIVGIRDLLPGPRDLRSRDAYRREDTRREDTRREDRGGWLALRRLGSIAERSADEYAFLLREIAREAALASCGAARGAADGGSAPSAAIGIGQAWLASVVPALTPRLCEAVDTAFGIACSVVGPGVRTGVKIRTDVPSEDGSDLVCAAAAARELVGGPCIIVDFGAALSVSAVNEAGEFLGCAIAPGIATAAESLRAVAAQIPEVRLDAPLRAIGRTTAQSVQAGILLGYGGLVGRLIELVGGELRESRDAPPARPPAGDAADARRDDSLARSVEVVGTGEALGRSLLASLGYGRFVPELALEGLAIIASRNAP